MGRRLRFEWILLLLLLPGVLASVPNNHITQLFDDEAINGENDIGELLIIAQQYSSQTYNRTNFTQVTLQRYDLFAWFGTESVSVKDPLNRETILVPGAQYYVTQMGLHTVTSLLNSSKTFNIIATGEPQNFVDINIDHVPNGFELEFSMTDFVLIDEEIIEATLIIDDDIEPGEYTINYTVNEEVLEYTFTVLSNIDWNISDVSFEEEQSIKSGEDRYIGFIEVNNIGNQDVEITLNKKGNQSSIVVVPQSKTLFRKSSIKFDIQLDVPSVTPTGTYDITIIADDESGKKQNITLEIEVIDALKPVIEQINFSTDKAFMENEIVVFATDNDDVVNLTLEYDDEKIFFKKDQNRFTATLVFNKISKYEFDFCAIDITGNQACEAVNRTFIKIDAIQGTRKLIKLPTVQYSKYSEEFLFNLTEYIDEGVSIELVSIESSIRDDEMPTIRLVDEDGGIKRFNTYDNEIIIKEVGRYNLEIRSEIEGDYEGIIRFNVPEYVEEVTDVVFEVSFKSYDIPRDFSVDWFGTNVVCEVIDTGDLDSSHRLCPIRIPIDISEKDIALPTTIREREQLDTQVVEVKEELLTSRKRAGLVITLLIVFLILSLIVLWYAINVYPYIRIIRKVKVK